MAKKIAAPRKAAPKASARKISKAKAVGVPKAYKPKGSPKEKLAYLNKGEMAALVKKKGSPARKGPRGLPSFADDSASSRGVSRGDTYGTKGSGSTKTATGSVSKSSETKSSPSGAGPGRGQGGQNSGVGRDSSRGLGQGAGGSAIGKGYNSGTKGSRSGGASTQKPGMGRNAGRVGPQSPMGGQGASFATNKAARDDTLRRAYGVEDERGIQNMPQRPYLDRKYGVTINPNLPPVDRESIYKERRATEDRDNREHAALAAGRYRNPQEIRSLSDMYEAGYDKQDAQAKVARENLQKSAPLSQGNFRANMGRAAASGRVPDIKIGGPRSGSSGDGYSGGGMGGTYRGGSWGGGWGGNSNNTGRGGQGWKAGGLVKKNSNKSFKKK